MLIPLTDPEHPLAKQMLRLIGAHSHRSESIDAAAVDGGPVVDDVTPAPNRRGPSIVDRVVAPRRRPATSAI
jgi:hypothetical protein